MSNLVENFNYVVYSDPTQFTNTSDGKIQLTQYSSNIVLYVPFDTNFDAKYSLGAPAATTTGTVSIQNFGVFGQYGYFQNNGLSRYDVTNFQNLSSQGTINFRFKTGFNNDPGRQDFLATTITPSDTQYKFNLYVGSHVNINVSVTLTNSDTIYSVFNKLYVVLTGGLNAIPSVVGNKIRVSASANGDSIVILPPTSGNSLITLLGGVGTSVIPNGPTATSVDLIQLYDGATNNNRIVLTHTGDSSNLILKMYDSAGTLKVNQNFGIWSNHYNQWYDFEIDWNTSIAQFFIDGTLFGVTLTGFSRGSGNYFYVQSGVNDFYNYDELIVYNTQQNSGTFAPNAVALSAYPTTSPYIDVHLGSSPKATAVQDFNLICSVGCYFVVQLGNTWYYYVASAWNVSDGSFSQSCTPSLIENKFTSLPFNEALQLTVRVYFHSDGMTNVWLSSMEVVTNVTTAVQAKITGMMNLSSPIDLSANYNVQLSTNVGGPVTVSCRTGAADSANVTLSEIKNAIYISNVPGLATPTDDGSGHLVLKSSTYGDSAWISISSAISNDALGIIFGASATGNGVTPSGDVIDYSELFRYVRAKLGEPTLPVEITDEQLMDCLADATFHYNRWRNFKEQLFYTTLSGGSRNGYDIPPIVGGEDNILEIIVKSRYPYSFYAGKSDDIIGNLYVQSIFHKWKSAGLLSDIISDYYLTISTAEDINIVLGTQIKWEIINHKIFLYPAPPTSLDVGIRYRAALSPQEVVTNYWVRRMVLAETKIVLGNIRSTFKSGIPGGTEMIQLNGAELMEEGKTEKAELIEEMKKSSEPLFLMWF